MAIGVTLEQHPDRSRLYQQWRQLQWPIFVDSLGITDLAVVPVPVFLDANGVVRARLRRPRDLEKWMRKEPVPSAGIKPLAPRKLATLRSEKRWRELGDAAFLQKTPDLDTAIAAYRRAIKRDAEDSRAHFRLGVALQRRDEGSERKPGDAKAAVAAWSRALELNPRQYIWRRRLQQYGPRLAKPYNFYFWVDRAEKEISARGESPHPLHPRPAGSELIGPGAEASPPRDLDPDPRRMVPEDSSRFVSIEAAAVPLRVRPGEDFRARVTLRPSPKRKPHWNDEGPGTRLGLRLPKGVRFVEGTLRYPGPPGKEEADQIPRTLDFELRIPDDAVPGKLTIQAYALYEICEDESGICRGLRREFSIEVQVDPNAPLLGASRRRK